VTGCDHDESGGENSKLRIAIEAMPTQLDPRHAMDAHSSRVGSLVFASLVTVGRDGAYRPYLAEALPQCRDDLSCVFRLREDFVFHDGTPVTSADVVATYHALMDPGLASPRRSLLARVAGVSAPSPHEVVLQMAEPDATMLEAASVAVVPARQAGLDVIPAEELVGCGPYRVSEVVDGSRVVLSAFEAFPDGEPAISTIEFAVVPDTLMRAMEVAHGTIDFVQNAIDPDTTDWLEREHDDVVVYRGNSSNFQYLGVNIDHPVLADVRVRRAIAYSIDRRTIVRHVLEDQAVVATGLLPLQHWAYSGDVRRYGFNPGRARRLLDRAGLVDPDGNGPRPRIVLSYKTTTDELRRRIAEAFAAQLAAVGIELEILSYEWGTFFSDIKRGNFHLYSLQWVGITDPDIYRWVFHSRMRPPAGNNRGGYRDALMDTLTDLGRVTGNREERRRIYARVQRRAAGRLPYIPLWWPQRVVVTRERLIDFSPHPAGDLLELRSARLRDRAVTEPQ